MKNKILILTTGLVIFLSACSEKCCPDKCNHGNKCLIKTKGTTMETNNEKEPLACSLNGAEMKDRRKTIEKFTRLILKKEETGNGMLFHLDGSNKSLEEILALLQLERQCCSFLRFDLKIQKESMPVQLAISGPEGTKDFLADELGL